MFKYISYKKIDVSFFEIPEESKDQFIVEIYSIFRTISVLIA